MDRERVIAELREHAAVGRLTLDEFSERTERALLARTLGELAALEADLPSRRRVRRRLSGLGLRHATGAYVVTNAVLLGGWVVTNKPGGLGAGPEPFWPAWPMLGSGVGFALFIVVRALRARDAGAGGWDARPS